jgi:hypothetical protein
VTPPPITYCWSRSPGNSCDGASASPAISTPICGRVNAESKLHRQAFGRGEADLQFR